MLFDISSPANWLGPFPLSQNKKRIYGNAYRMHRAPHNKLVLSGSKGFPSASNANINNNENKNIRRASSQVDAQPAIRIERPAKGSTGSMEFLSDAREIAWNGRQKRRPVYFAEERRKIVHVIIVICFLCTCVIHFTILSPILNLGTFQFICGH